MPDTFLVTGALGCIGAWACRQLVGEGAGVVGFDLGDSRHRHELVMSPAERAAVTMVHGDLTDLAALERVLAEHGITHVIHLAAMQIPLARADPPRAAQVNVAGTVNVFAAAKRHGLRGLAYASSTAVFGRDDGVRVDEDADGHPATHYGVHKVANEGAARIYWQDDGIASIGLRPYVVYGPGRDQGMTAEPTKAMAAAARGEGFHMAFGGRMQMHYAPATAGAFVAAARAAHEGAVVRHLGGPPVHMSEVVAAIEAVVPEVRGQVTFDEAPLPHPEELEASAPVDVPLERGVRETIELFRTVAPARG